MEKHPAAPSWRLVGTGAGGHLLPQAVHRLRRRQVGDQQEPGRRGAVRPDLRPATSRRTWRWSRRSSSRTSTTRSARAAAEHGRARPLLSRGALARLGDQAADAQPRSSPPSTTPGSSSIPNHIRALVFIIKRFYRPEWGDDWRSHFTRRHHQRRARPRAQVRRPQAGRQLPARRPASRARRLAHLQAAAGLRRRRQGADGGRHHRLRRRAGPPRCSASRGEYDGHPSLKLVAELRVPAVPAPRRRHPPAASTSRPRSDMARAGLFCSNFQPLDRERRARHGARTWRLHDAFTAPMREHVNRNAARDDDG